jgi:hypothetical protein
MTDTRLPSSWLTSPIMDGLSDRAWRSFTGSLMWSNESGTDGVLPQRAARFFHPEGVDSSTLAELVDAGLWEPFDGGLRIPGWTELGQEPASVIAQRRENNRIRQQNWRDKQSAELKKPPRQSKPVTDDVTRYVRQESDSDRDSDSDREQATTAPSSESKKSTTEWPVAEIGKGRVAS